MAAGLASVCALSTTPPDSCETQTGPTGLFNWDTNRPIPNFSELTEFGIYIHHEERHKAWNELVGLRRIADLLPFPEENVGLLLGRFGNEDSKSRRFQLLRESCTVTARSGSEDRLGIGANDYRALDVRELGQGIWQITVIWSSIAITEPCQESDLSLNAIILDHQIVGQ